MQVVYKIETPPGPAGRGLIDRLMVYAKARREDSTPDEKKTVRKLAVVLKGKPK